MGISSQEGMGACPTRPAFCPTLLAQAIVVSERWVHCTQNNYETRLYSLCCLEEAFSETKLPAHGGSQKLG
jgi:hypothetical protein